MENLPGSRGGKDKECTYDLLERSLALENLLPQTGYAELKQQRELEGKSILLEGRKVEDKNVVFYPSWVTCCTALRSMASTLDWNSLGTDEGGGSRTKTYKFGRKTGITAGLAK